MNSVGNFLHPFAKSAAPQPISFCKHLFVKASKSTDEGDKFTYGWESLLPDLESKIKPENLLGSGSSSRVYALNDDYVLRLSCGKESVGKQKFSAVKDIFEGRNFGQPVARSKCGYITISKRIHGEQLYKINEVLYDENYDTGIYIKKLREYVDLPEATLEQLVDDTAFINGKGWRTDPTNSENYLYDRKTGKIGIVDIEQQGSSSLDLFDPYGHDWILDPLVNGHDLAAMYDKSTPAQREEIIDLIAKLENRILPLCEKYGIPKAKWNAKEYMFSSLVSVLETREQLDYNNGSMLEQIIELKYPHLAERLLKNRKSHKPV